MCALAGQNANAGMLPPSDSESESEDEGGEGEKAVPKAVPAAAKAKQVLRLCNACIALPGQWNMSAVLVGGMTSLAGRGKPFFRILWNAISNRDQITSFSPAGLLLLFSDLARNAGTEQSVST